MFPYHLTFFVIAMEVFSKLMNQVAKDKNMFKFHPKFDKVKLSQLCFVDDLLVFPIAKEPTIQSI